MVRRPSSRSGSGRRPSWRSGSSWETLLMVRKWLEDPPGGLEVVGRPYRRSGTGRETLP